MTSYKPVKLAYNKLEPSDGNISTATPVIFLHAIIVSKEQFGDIPQIIADKAKRKVYIVDARNHGDSEWTDEFNFDINADDILHFMDTVGEKKAVLIGHSMGGITAMKAALKEPEKIERVIIEDMQASKFPPEMFAMMSNILTMLRKIVQEIPPELTEKEATKYAEDLASKNIDKKMEEYFKRKTDPTKSHYYFVLKQDSSGCYTFKANIDVILRDLIKDEVQQELTGSYDGPAHFIFGKLSDFKMINDADNIKRHFPNAEFTEIEEATHNVHGDCPEEFVETLLKYLA